MGNLTSRLCSAVGTSDDSWFLSGVCSVLIAGGPIPKHVAVVMDGNRRFARSRNFSQTRGHEFGADKLISVLRWCLALDVTVLSVYAFSLDNLRRDPEEVKQLFELATTRLNELANSPMIHEKQVRVRVVGDLRNVPETLRIASANCTSKTWHHQGPVLNVCFAYTGREDIAQAVGAVGEGLAAGKIQKTHVSEKLLEKCFRGAAFESVAATVCTTGVNESVVTGKGKHHGGKKRPHRPMGTLFDDFSVWDTDESGKSCGSESDCEREKTEGFDTRNRGRGDDAAGSSGRRFIGGKHGNVREIKGGHMSLLSNPPSARSVPPVDLLIRTSGETRLSDFILWGVSQHAVLCFLEGAALGISQIPPTVSRT
jgi:undecaprenyl diphosphate synthase